MVVTSTVITRLSRIRTAGLDSPANISTWGGEMPTVLFLGKQPMTAKVVEKTLGNLQNLPEDISGKVEWKRFPDDSAQLRRLLVSHPCIVDVDTLDNQGVLDLAETRMIDRDYSAWVLSRSKGSMELIVGGCSSALIKLQPVPV